VNWSFIAHDTLHDGVIKMSATAPRRRCLLSGRSSWWAREGLAQLNGGALFGICAIMWREEHSAHHAYTMRPHADPQFTYFPFFFQTERERPHWEAELPRGRLRTMVWALVVALNRVQHLLWLPLCVWIGRVNFLILAWANALKRGRRAHRDLLAMSVHVAWYAGVLSLLPTTSERLIFTGVHYSTVGVLHVQLLLSHMMAPQHSVAEERSLGFFAFQLRTTRNLKSSALTHWFHGGLEKQIEHHLFPQLPRHRLAAVAPRVRAIAARHGIEYAEMGSHEALFLCLGQLRKMSAALMLADVM